MLRADGGRDKVGEKIKHGLRIVMLHLHWEPFFVFGIFVNRKGDNSANHSVLNLTGMRDMSLEFCSLLAGRWLTKRTEIKGLYLNHERKKDCKEELWSDRCG